MPSYLTVQPGQFLNRMPQTARGRIEVTDDINQAQRGVGIAPALLPNLYETPEDGAVVEPAAITVAAAVVAESAQQRGEWVSALRVVSEKAATSRAELSMTSKLTYDARRRMEIENKRRDAERRKAEIMKNGGMVGMKHTARAMASR